MIFAWLKGYQSLVYCSIDFRKSMLAECEVDFMANLIEFFRMVLSYLLTFAVIVVVSGIGGFIGVKVWKPKVKVEEVKEDEAVAAAAFTQK